MIVNVDKNSWHYRWYRWLTKTFRGPDYHWKDPYSVCPYFWGFVLNNLWASFLLILITACVCVVAGLVSSPIWGAIYWYIKGNPKPFFVGVCSLGIIATIIGAVVAWERRDDISDKLGDATKNGTMGVIRGVLYSIKNKVCPTINYREKRE